MKLSQAPLKRVFAAPAQNAKRPQHLHLHTAAPGYTFNHAHMLSSVSTGAAGPLPANMGISNAFLQSLIEGLDPAEKNWSDKKAHVFVKAGSYNPMYMDYEDCFMGLTYLIDDCIDEMLTEFPDGDSEWPFGWSRDKFIYFQSLVVALRHRQKISFDTAYVNLPFVTLVALDMLLQLDNWVETTWAAGELARFQAFLRYPTSDPTSYSLNVNYLHPRPAHRGPPTQRHLLVGFRLGRIIKGVDRNGRAAAAISLQKAQITTAHWKEIPVSACQTGFVCALNFI